MRNGEGNRPLRQAVVIVALFVLGAGAAHADKICFNQFGHPALPGAPPNPPDGNLDDQHWTNSFLFDYNNGTPKPDATLKVGRDGTNLYFGWAVNNSTSFANTDRVILAFQDSVGNFRRIDIQPVCDNQAGGLAQFCDANGNVYCAPSTGITQCSPQNTLKPWGISYQTGQLQGSGPTATVNWAPSTTPAGIQVAAKATGTGTPGSSNVWSVEIIMPASNGASNGYTINNNAWKLYSDVFRVDPTSGGVTELTWPDAPPNVMVITTLQTPAVGNWGDASIAGGCSGVHVTRLYTNGTINNGATPDPLLINTDRTDMKVMADVANTGNANASCVRTTLRLANFGISNTWKLVPPPNSNPTAPQNIAALGSTTYTVGPWDVTTDPDKANYLPGAHPHQCIRADLDVYTGPPTNCNPGGSTTIDQASTFQNMDFGHSSVFTREAAEIRGDYAPPPPGQAKNKFELFVVGKPSLIEGGARLTVMVNGTIHTAKFIDLPTGRIVNDRSELIRYEIMQRTPSFGYVIDHPLNAVERAAFEKLPEAEKLKAWDIGLGGLQSRNVPGLYSVEVGPTEVAKVAPRVEFTGVGAPPSPKCCFSVTQKPSTTPVAMGGLIFIGALAYRLGRNRRR